MKAYQDEITLIKKWIIYLMTQDMLPSEMLDKDFTTEDGMNLEQYWKYERESFQTLSQIYDLTPEFEIKILHHYQLTQDKQFYFIYIINSIDKIVCKMNITLKKIDDKLYISSNDYHAQIVPKFAIWEGVIKEIGLAIKTIKPLKKIIASGLECIYLREGNNFSQDGFYSARFMINQMKLINFSLYMDDKGSLIKEKRTVFFDDFDLNMKPYEVIDTSLKILNYSYPVNLAAIGDEGLNVSYPRNISIDLNRYNEVIVTDCLDNDWHVNS